MIDTTTARLAERNMTHARILDQISAAQPGSTRPGPVPADYVIPLCPGDDPGADWQQMGWCCRDCAALAHTAWCPNHPEWACRRCGVAWFGTPPETLTCPTGCTASTPKEHHP